MCVYIHIYQYANMYIFVYTHIQYTHIHIHIYTHTHTYVCMSICKYANRVAKTRRIPYLIRLFQQKSPILSGSFVEMICNLGDPMSLRHPVIMYAYTCAQTYKYKYTHIHICILFAC